MVHHIIPVPVPVPVPMVVVDIGFRVRVAVVGVEGNLAGFDKAGVGDLGEDHPCTVGSEVLHLCEGGGR